MLFYESVRYCLLRSLIYYHLEMRQTMIYLDYCSTTPMSREAIETYAKVASTYFGNEQSLHDDGAIAKQIVEQARNVVSNAINGRREGIFFTGGGSDSNYHALLSLALAHEHKGKHIITSPVEHPSVTNTLKVLEERGFTISIAPVNRYGEVSIEELAKLIRPDTILVTICHASSEIGTIQPLEEIGQLLANKNILFHSDCVQTFGKIALDVERFRLSAISISAHKIYGPKGVGACYIDPKVSWRSIVPQTTHQRGFKQGTLNSPGIAAFAVAVSEILEFRDKEEQRFRQLQQHFLKQMDAENISLLGHPTKRLPNHLSLRIDKMEGQEVMLECNRHDLAISTGSACMIGQADPPQSLLAMGFTMDEANGLFRISFGRQTTVEHIDKAIHVIHQLSQIRMKYK